MRLQAVCVRPAILIQLDEIKLVMCNCLTGPVTAVY